MSFSSENKLAKFIYRYEIERVARRECGYRRGVGRLEFVSLPLITLS